MTTENGWRQEMAGILGVHPAAIRRREYSDGEQYIAKLTESGRWLFVCWLGDAQKWLRQNR